MSEEPQQPEPTEQDLKAEQAKLMADMYPTRQVSEAEEKRYLELDRIACEFRILLDSELDHAADWPEQERCALEDAIGCMKYMDALVKMREKPGALRFEIRQDIGSVGSAVSRAASATVRPGQGLGG